MSGIRVEAADLSRRVHAEALRAVLSSYARDPMGGERDLPAEVLGGVVPGLLAHPTTRVWLAFEDDAAVGMAICFLGFSTFAARPLLNVHDLAVLPAHRGRGVGRALLVAAEAGARAEGCCKLTLEVREDNGRARGLYASCGFGHFAPGLEQTPTLFLEKPL